jgi:zinc protease
MRRMIASLMAATLLTGPLAAQELPTTPPPIPAPKAFKVPASETFTLANGMKVTLIPYGVAPKVVVSLQTYAGSLNEGENTWLGLLAVDMLKEGAAGMTAAQIAQKAAEMGGGLGTNAGAESSSVTLNVLSERAADAIALVADVAQKPSYPESELARVKANWNRRLAVALSQPGTLANAALTRAYYGADHPYGRVLPTPQQFGAYTTAQLKAWHAANFGAKRSHLYIAGKFDAAVVKAAVEKAFGGWAAGPERLSLPPSPKPGPQVLLVDRPGAPQSTFSIAYPAPNAGTPGDIPMRVSNALLGGSFSYLFAGIWPGFLPGQCGVDVQRGRDHRGDRSGAQGSVPRDPHAAGDPAGRRGSGGDAPVYGGPVRDPELDPGGAGGIAGDAGLARIAARLDG